MGTPLFWSLPHAASAAAVARQVLRQRCADLPAPVLDDAILLVTEVVANAVRHGEGPLTLALSRSGERLRVEVSDGSRARPRPRQSGLDAESGRGLQIVDVLASRWGTRPARGPGKTVWFELDVDHSRQALLTR